jgi:hypothetical protein
VLDDLFLVNAEAGPDQPQCYFIKSFPSFLFMPLGRMRWNFGTFENDYGRVDFPLALDMTRYAQDISIPHW